MKYLHQHFNLRLIKGEGSFACHPATRKAMPCLLVMDAQDGRIVTSHARRDVEDAYDDEIRGGGKGYLGLFLGEHAETCLGSR